MWSDFVPSAIAFHIGQFAIHWYGLIMALAMLLGYVIIMHLNKTQAQLDEKMLGDVIFYIIVFGLIGARLYHILLDIPYYAANLAEIIAVWHGGLAIHGGIIVGFLTILWFVKKRGLDLWKFADMAVIATILGQAMGRWGNFFNQEIFGRPTDLPWKIFISSEHRPEIYADITYFHPTFLYESLLNFVLFIILLWLYKSRKVLDGSITLFYIISYSLIRFSLEFIRIDPTPTFGFIRWPQVASLILIIVSIIIIVRRSRD